MEPNQRFSPNIPHRSSFAAQSRPTTGYIRPELEHVHREHFQGHRHQHGHLNLHHHPYPRPFSYAPPFAQHPSSYANHLPPYAHNMHEAIQREIEKQQIREEIIMSELSARRRALEAEVRRELMMDGFPFSSGFDSPTRVSLLGKAPDGRHSSSLEDRENRLNLRHDSGGFETSPVCRGTSADLRISEVKPMSEGNKEREKIILLPKPNESISGSKRKAGTPPIGADASVLPQPESINSKKKSKEAWSCALCQVNTTCERALNEHLRGKRHKAKEAAAKAQRTGKNYTIGLFPKSPAKPAEVASGIVDPILNEKVKLKDESLPLKKTVDASNSRKFKFWCELCGIGVQSNKLMKMHKKGKKHLRKLEVGPTNEKKKILVEKVNEETWYETATGSEDREPTIEMEKDIHKPAADETNVENNEAPMDIANKHEPVDEANGEIVEAFVDVAKLELTNEVEQEEVHTATDETTIAEDVGAIVDVEKQEGEVTYRVSVEMAKDEEIVVVS